MKVKILGRTIEIANRVNVDSFKDEIKNEGVLIGISFRKSDMKRVKNIKKFLLYCFMPYTWLDTRFKSGRI